jgi:multiple sugar transport system substrate-binding protein
MKTKKFLLIITIMVLVLFAAACQPKAEEPMAEEPAAEEPMAEEPAAEEPMAEEPAAEEPTAEEPMAEEPMDEGPCAPATEGPLAGVDPRGQTVVWWHNHDDDPRVEFLAKYITEFNDTNECGITVEDQLQGSYDDIRDKMNAGIATGDLPGLVVGYQNDQAFYALADGLADLNLYIDDPTWGLGDEKSDYFESFLNQGVHPAFGGARLGFPPNRSMLMLFYNITWLKELGFDGSPPETPDELREMACAAAEANGDGTGGLIIDTGASAFAGWTFAFGGDILNTDGTGYAYNNAGSIAAMEFIKGLQDDGCAYVFTEGYPDPEFAARRAIFTTGSSSGLPYYESGVVTVGEELGREPDEWSAGALPHTTPDPVQNIYGGDVMIPATTPERQLAAWIFIKYYTSPEVQAAWVKASNYFPTRAATEEFLGDYMSENPQWAEAVKLLPFGYYEPQLISYQAVRDATSQAYNAILQGADIQQTLDDLNTEANELQAELVE